MPLPLQPYYVVPLLVEQPTWGGEYIPTFKSLSHSAIAGLKIGQSFELMAASRLIPSLGAEPAFGIAYGGKVTQPKWYGAEQSLSLSELASDQKTAVFGEKLTSEFSTLIKFTQAQNNSYQVHIKPGSALGHWQAKPESWYYFEKGKATLGLNSTTAVTDYQQRCEGIDGFAQELSQQIKNGQQTVAAARIELEKFINQDHPNRFVQTVWIEAGQTVDLSTGGIHHSWEKDVAIATGNIVYEVQVDVLDENCTLRSFDQGNIKDDGTVRTLSIQEYFQALDTSASANQVEQYLQEPIPEVLPEGEVLELFTTTHYRSYQVTFNQNYQGNLTQTNGSFHHLFVREGSGVLSCTAGDFNITKGNSLFVPAGLSTYQLQPTGTLQVIITTL